MANKADKAQSRGEIPIYVAKSDWTSMTQQLAATDAPTAARIYAERLWKADKWPTHYDTHKAGPLASIEVSVAGPDGVTKHTVRLKMEAAFEVVL